MRTRFFRWIALSLFVGVMLTGCNLDEPTTGNVENASLATDESFGTTELEQFEELEAFRDESYALAISNDLMIAELKSKASVQNAAVRAEYQARVNNLEEWNDNMKERLANYREDEYSNWEAFTNEFRQDMDALGQAINYLAYMESSSRELTSVKSAQ